MSFKTRIRSWLGFDDVRIALESLQQEILELRNDLQVTFKDEFDPGRQEMSKRLGEKAIKKLQAEDWARRHSIGEV